MAPTTYVGPTSVGGVVMRVVTNGKRAWSEIWAGPAGGWVKGGEIRDCMVNPAATPEVLRRASVPESDWIWPERERSAARAAGRAGS